jgi:glucose dehydrogenase
MSRVAWAPLWFAVFLHSHAVAFLALRRVREAVRCAAGVIGACASYMAVMLPIVLLYPPTGPKAASLYAVGMAIATVAGTFVAGWVFPRRLRERGMVLCVGLLLTYPVAVAALSEPAAPVRFMQSLYLFATAAGGGFALTMMSQRRRGLGQAPIAALARSKNPGRMS